MTMKFDIPTLAKEFLALEAEMSDLIYKSDSLAKEGEGKISWERFKELEQIRRQKISDLFTDNEPDKKYDYVHDAILCDDNDVPMPKGYVATVIASNYNSIVKHYYTIAVVNTPQNTQYLISVPTYNKIKIETIFK